jgi:hypothetical protein
MCFSASVSFSAGAVLLVIGAVAVKRIRNWVELPFALVPSLFGIQQLIEGALWLTLPGNSPHLNAVLTQVYSAFSQVLWPIYIPVSVLLLERHVVRRRVMAALTLAGAAVSLFLLYYMAHRRVVAQVNGHHITYIFPHFHEAFASGLYLLGACLSPLLSSHRYVRLFGIAVTLSLIATYAFYSTWFISVWCFFSAILSSIVLLHFYERRQGFT